VAGARGRGPRISSHPLLRFTGTSLEISHKAVLAYPFRQGTQPSHPLILVFWVDKPISERKIKSANIKVNMGLFNIFQKKTQPIQTGLQEKRTLPRWKISAPAKIKLLGSNAYLVCEVKDLNFKGFCLIISEKIPDGCSGFELYFNDNFSFNIGIEVSWAKEVDGKHVYGMKFVGLRGQDKERILQMVQERFPENFQSKF